MPGLTTPADPEALFRTAWTTAPEVTVIHGALLDADHAQPDVVDTLT